MTLTFYIWAKHIQDTQHINNTKSITVVQVMWIFRGFSEMIQKDWCKKPTSHSLS